jgi:pimeloyl-ACP methyl ester carboxylesterase
MRQQQGMAEVNGTQLYYEVAGSGRPLVLIHGFTLDARMWDDQFETFAERYQVIRYDARGFGRSAVPTGESYAPADDLRALMSFLGVEHAFIVGLSMGGGIAIDFALSYPEATDALIAVDSLLGGYRWQEFGASLASVWSAARRSGVEAAKDVWLDLPLFEPAREKADIASRLGQIIADYSGWHLVNENPVRSLDPPAAERLDDIAAPTLIVVGERDLPDFRAIADALHEGIPGAQKVVLPGVGHMSNMENPARFNQAVVGFLAGIRAP